MNRVKILIIYKAKVIAHRREADRVGDVCSGQGVRRVLQRRLDIRHCNSCDAASELLQSATLRLHECRCAAHRESSVARHALTRHCLRQSEAVLSPHARCAHPAHQHTRSEGCISQSLPSPQVSTAACF